MTSPKHVALASNCAWNLIHFRAPLINEFQKRGLRVTAVVPDDGDAGCLRERGIEVWPVPINRSGRSPAADIHLLSAYVRALRKLRPSAFLTFTAKPNIYGALAGRIAGVPVISNISGLGTGFLAGAGLELLLTALYKIALARAAVVFFQNEDDRSLFLRRRMVRMEQAALICGSGVNLEVAVTPLAGRSGPMRFLLVARMLGDKGIREFIAAAEMLQSEGFAVHCSLLGPAGDDNRSAMAADELIALDEKGAVRWFGETRDVGRFLEAADVIVLPSYREGMPRTLLEAAAYGRPVITSNVPGCRQAVVPGVTGLLCEPRDAESLAEAMREMIRLGPSGRAEFGSANRARAEAEFDERFVVEAYLNALRTCDLDV